MSKPLFISAAIALVGFISGCATMVFGTQQEVDFSSAQPGSSIVVYDDAHYGFVHEYKGELPAKVNLYRKKFYKIDFIHPDYPTQTIKLKAGYNYGDALSNLFVVTMAVDTVTGASKSFPERIMIDFAKPNN